jgi:hypothetical protein
MTPLLWTILPFAVLVVLTAILCVAYKIWNWNCTSSVGMGATKLGVILCHLYLPLAAIGWGYVLLGGWIGYGWAMGVYLVFLFAPWFFGAKPINIFLMFPIQAAKNFADVRLEGWGFIRLPGLAGNSVFVASGKDQRQAMREIVSQIKTQLREQVRSPVTRWLLFHRRWYEPLVGGYSCRGSVAETLDDAIHNTYGFPITRLVSISAPTCFAGSGIVEMNM